MLASILFGLGHSMSPINQKDIKTCSDSSCTVFSHTSSDVHTFEQCAQSHSISPLPLLPPLLPIRTTFAVSLACVSGLCLCQSCSLPCFSPADRRLANRGGEGRRDKALWRLRVASMEWQQHLHIMCLRPLSHCYAGGMCVLDNASVVQHSFPEPAGEKEEKSK